jgi:integrase
MARKSNRLSALVVTNIKEAGLYSDGEGLYLQVTPAGVKSWLYRYMRKGIAKSMGLGPLHAVSLAKARIKKDVYKAQLFEGVDPFDTREEQQKALATGGEVTMTFRQCAEAYHTAHKDGWRNKKHADQWINTLKTHAFPELGLIAVEDVDVHRIMKVLEPIWRKKTETASRLRGRMEAVLDWARVRGYRTGENPARWKGHLDHLLLPRSKVNKVEHHAALPFDEIADFIVLLRKHERIAQLALEFTILVAARTSEVLNMTWQELSLDLKIWTVPASRMKANREHRVPLSNRAFEILKTMERCVENEFVFPGRKAGRPLSNMALLQILRRMDRGDLTVHGFRSTFRDWAAECTNHSREVAEMALAHIRQDKTEAAYARGDLFEKRRKLMEEWADYCNAAVQPSKLLLTVKSNEKEIQ